MAIDFNKKYSLKDETARNKWGRALSHVDFGGKFEICCLSEVIRHTTMFISIKTRVVSIIMNKLYSVSSFNHTIILCCMTFTAFMILFLLSIAFWLVFLLRSWFSMISRLSLSDFYHKYWFVFTEWRNTWKFSTAIGVSHIDLLKGPH